MPRRSLVVVIALTIFVLPALALAQWIPNGNPVSTATDDQTYSRVIGDTQGGVIVVWADHRTGSNWDLYAQRYDGFGQRLWTNGGVAVCTSNGDQWKQSMAPDDSGGVYIAWEDSRSGNVDIYAQHLDKDGAALWGPQGRVVCNDASNQGGGASEGPHIVRSDKKAARGGPGVIICWPDPRNAPTLTDIYAQRMDEAGADWTANGVVICGAVDYQSSPQMASDGTGGAILTWRDSRAGSLDDNIYAQRVNQGGVVQWTTDGEPVCTAAYDQDKPRIAAGDSGDVYISWVDKRLGLVSPYALYVQRMDGSGAPVWTVDGLNVYGNVEYDEAELAPDGAGGVIVSWRDPRNGLVDIFAQRFDGAGNKLWATLGVPVCNVPGDDKNHRMAGDGVGGAWVVWDNGGFPILEAYVQHVDSLGAPDFPLGGQYVTQAPDRQNIPDVCVDTDEPAFVAWSDYRSSNDPDVYVTRVYHTVTGVGDNAPRVPELSLCAVPNPFNAGTEVRVDGAAAGPVSFAVYDVAGRRVAHRVLAVRGAGVATRIPFDGRDDAGRALPSGVYLVRVRAGGVAAAAKIVVMH